MGLLTGWTQMTRVGSKLHYSCFKKRKMELLEFALSSKLEPASGRGTCVLTPGLKGPIKCEGTKASEQKGVLVHRLHPKKLETYPLC